MRDRLGPRLNCITATLRVDMAASLHVLPATLASVRQHPAQSVTFVCSHGASVPGERRFNQGNTTGKDGRRAMTQGLNANDGLYNTLIWK